MPRYKRKSKEQINAAKRCRMQLTGEANKKFDQEDTHLEASHSIISLRTEDEDQGRIEQENNAVDNESTLICGVANQHLVHPVTIIHRGISLDEDHKRMEQAIDAVARGISNNETVHPDVDTIDTSDRLRGASQVHNVDHRRIEQENYCRVDGVVDQHPVTEAINTLNRHRGVSLVEDRKIMEQAIDAVARGIVNHDAISPAANTTNNSNCLPEANIVIENDNWVNEQEPNAVVNKITISNPDCISPEKINSSNLQSGGNTDKGRRRMEEAIYAVAHGAGSLRQVYLSADKPLPSDKLYTQGADIHNTARETFSKQTNETNWNSTPRRHRCTDENKRSAAIERDSARIRKRRENSGFREEENAVRRVRRQLFSQTYDSLQEEYNSLIRLSPTVICSCCGCLWYKTSTTAITEEELIEKDLHVDLISQVLCTNLNAPQFCTTCKRNILVLKKVPRLALSNGFEFPVIPNELKDLTPLEERLVALRIPFMQIRLRGTERQSTILGNVVNVENDLLMCTKSIPRPMSQTGTVHVKLQRRMNDPKPYMEERIRTHKVYEAAKYLIDTELYKSEDVQLCDEWANHEKEDTVDVFDDDDEIMEEQPQRTKSHETSSVNQSEVINDENSSSENHSSCAPREKNSNQDSENCFDNDQWEDVEEGYKDSKPLPEVNNNSSTVNTSPLPSSAFVPRGEESTFSISSNNEDNLEEIHVEASGCKESLVYLDKEIEYQGIKIAPGEANRPIPFFLDKEAEEMSFPTIYCGTKRRFKVKVSYTDIAKSEIRRHDRRACNASHLLYAFKKSLNEKVYSALQVCLRKGSGSKKITVKDTKTPGYLQNLIEKDDGYAVFKQIRSSPCYWKQQQKKVNGMIRQCGRPQFFITLSAAETRWTELLKILTKIVRKEEITEEEASKLSFLEKAELIKKDPVTCMIHFDHRFRQLLNKLLKPKNGVFAPYVLEDYFARLEYQMRGSAHIHSIHWLKDGPLYTRGNKELEKAVINFIDTYITCKRDEEGDMDELLGYQLHKHSHTCYKKNRNTKICRFGFPKPPLPETMILHPFEKNDDKKTIENCKEVYKRIREALTNMGRSFKENISFEEFLQDLSLTKQQYILAVRSSIRRSTVFLRRQTSEVFINNYNKKLLIAWRANIDIQFILDTYACTKYCVGYITKSDGGVSKLLRAVEQEVKAGNFTVQEKLKKFARVLCHGCEVSTQEASAFLLGLRNTYCSKQEVFINTNEPMQRTGFLKPQRELEKLDDDSEEVFVKGLFDHYTNRPSELDNVCLAEFASMYDKVGVRKKKENVKDSEDCNTEDEDSESENEDVVTFHVEKNLALKDGSGYMRLRQNRKIIRFRNYSKETDYPNYCRERLTLYKPWRCEQKELLEVNCVTEAEKYNDEIKKNAKPFFSISEDEEKTIHDLIREIDNEDDDDDDIMRRVFQNDEGVQRDEEAMVGRIGQKGRPRVAVEQFRPPRLIEEDQYLALMRSLNEKQRRFVLNVIHVYKTSAEPFYHFLSGGAGVGKSHVIFAIVQSILRIDFRQPTQNPGQTPVLVCAPTGKAAFNVNGMTLHTTFRLPANQDLTWTELTESKANTYRALLTKTKLIIIDEVSMVNSNQLHQIDKRLQQLFCNYRDFGGISIIVVGHMRQLSPIMSKHVFLPSNQFPNPLCENVLWKNFTYFELEEIMRQRGQHQFCQGLNNMSEGIMSSSEIDLFKSREISPTNQPPSNAIWLFYSNRECQEYNEKLHQTFSTEGAWAIAHDMVKGEENPDKMVWMLKKAETFQASDAEGLPYKTHLQIGAEYFVSTNIDVSDGLFNGSTGTLRLIEYGINSVGRRVPTQVWVEFHNMMVGAASRANTRAYQREKHININWTLIKRHERSMNLGKDYRGIELIRKQLPLVAANAMTIAKSQGSSLPCVVVTPNTKTHAGRSKAIKREELYVGCSRATSLEGLYINGPFKKPSPPGINDVVTKELEALKSRPMKFVMRFLQDFKDTSTTVYFMNVQSFRKHYEDIKSDACPMSADYIALIEPHITEEDDITLDGFRIAHRTNSTNHHRSDGSLMLLNERNNFPIITEKTFSDTAGHCLCVNWKYGDIDFIMTYRSPRLSITAYKERLQSILVEKTNGIVFFGDINIDLSKSTNKSFIEFMAKFSLESKLDVATSTTVDGTHIDCLFSNLPNIEAFLYETYYSHHNAICFILPKNSD